MWFISSNRPGLSVSALHQVALLVVLTFSFSVQSQTLNFTDVPDGYVAGSIPLPLGFAGGLGVDPTDNNVVYASVGSFQANQLARIDVAEGTARVVAAGPFGSVSGIAVLSATQIALVDNAPIDGATDGAILLAEDINTDGDFDDTGEIRELITPILTDGDFSGAQAHVAPAGNPFGIPGGSVLLQSADGNGNSEILVIEDPLGTPAFRPVDGAFFSGFDFNGGFGFDSQGRILMGAAQNDFTGNVLALVNINRDLVIDASESNVILDGAALPNGISDLTIDGEDDGFCSSGGSILGFPIPADPLVGSASASPFALTDSGFLTAVRVNSKDRSFDPKSGPNGATMLIGGFTATFSEGTNLLTLTPSADADLNGDGSVNALDFFLFQEQWQAPEAR